MRRLKRIVKAGIKRIVEGKKKVLLGEGRKEKKLRGEKRKL